MITKRRLTELVLIWISLIAFIIILSSCKKEPITPFEGQSIKGLWNVETVNGTSSIIETINFKEDSVTFKVDTFYVTGAYSFVNNVLIISEDTNQVLKLDNHNLEFITTDGSKYVLSR